MKIALKESALLGIEADVLNGFWTKIRRIRAFASPRLVLRLAPAKSRAPRAQLAGSFYAKKQKIRD